MCEAISYVGHTVGDFKAQKTDEEEGGDVGEVVALEFEVHIEAHDSRVL